jgi:peroxiredoxin Q/BCP
MTIMETLILTTAALLIAAPTSIAAAPKAGDPAPLFEAPSTAGTIRLADYRGKKPVILAFYFADFTSG